MESEHDLSPPLRLIWAIVPWVLGGMAMRQALPVGLAPTVSQVLIVVSVIVIAACLRYFVKDVLVKIASTFIMRLAGGAWLGITLATVGVI